MLDRAHTARQLESYVLGGWRRGAGEGKPLLNAATGETHATITSDGLDFAGALDWGRDVGGAYSIPPNNLAAQTGQEALPEIWAYGLRNPWRLSFDRESGQLWVGNNGYPQLDRRQRAAGQKRRLPGSPAA